MHDRPSPARPRRRWLRAALAAALALVAALGGGAWWALSPADTLFQVTGTAAPDAPRRRLQLEFRDADRETRTVEFEIAEGQTVYFGPLRRRLQLCDMARRLPGFEDTKAFATFGRWLLPTTPDSLVAAKLTLAASASIRNAAVKVSKDKKSATFNLGRDEMTGRFDLGVARISGIRSISFGPQVSFQTKTGVIVVRTLPK